MLTYDIRTVDETGSTNDDAKAAAAAGAVAGTVIRALRQTAGRGRRGRPWTTSAGNLTFSIVLRPSGGPASFGHYSFIAALAIAEAVRDVAPKASVVLKWPNDVLVDGKKISGILLEAEGTALIVGIGLNVAHTPDNPLYPATSLAAAGSPVTAYDMLQGVLDGLSRWVLIYEQDGFAPVRAAWLAQARKGEMVVRLANEEIKGVFTDLDAAGNLHLALPDGGIRAFGAGDVFF